MHRTLRRWKEQRGLFEQQSGCFQSGKELATRLEVEQGPLRDVDQALRDEAARPQDNLNLPPGGLRLRHAASCSAQPHEEHHPISGPTHSDRGFGRVQGVVLQS